MITVYRNVDKQVPPYAPQRLRKQISDLRRDENLKIPVCFLAAALTFLFRQAHLLLERMVLELAALLKVR
jgi:hypothetical protein